MKKIIFAIILFFSLGYIVYADPQEVIIDNYKININFEDNAIIIEETFRTKDNISNIEVQKAIPEQIYDFESNCLDLGEFYDNNFEHHFIIKLEDNTDYYIKYKIKNDYYSNANFKLVNISGPYSNDNNIVFTNFSFGIKTLENEIIEIDELKNKGRLYDFEIERDGNFITGYYEGNLYYNPCISFDKPTKNIKTSITDNIYIKVMLVVSAIMLLLCIMKIITKNVVYDYLYVAASLVEIGLYIANRATMILTSSDLTMLVPFAFCIVLYGMFIYFAFFKKSNNIGRNEIFLEAFISLFIKLFILIHAYAMLSGVTSSTASYNPLDIMANIDYIILALSLLFTSVGYEYFGTKKEQVY